MTTPARSWLGVVSADHVRHGVELGIAQIGHGKKVGLSRLGAGDGFVYYSPKETLGGTTPLKQFTAIGTVPDDEIWQAEDGDFRPWRRRIDYVRDAHPVAVADLAGGLDLTSGPNWGYQLRLGLVPLTAHDFELLLERMTS